ncbi:MAG: cupin domain-containing protein [Candidatus Synoicihabitans palmerolidicus]|nr:cupin domain-containing protein [Candidatus Synoicihabitans palmerolidicus]
MIEEIYYVVAGTGVMTIDGISQTIRIGDAVVIKPGERHSIANQTPVDLRMIVTCTPEWTPDCLKFD